MLNQLKSKKYLVILVLLLAACTPQDPGPQNTPAATDSGGSYPYPASASPDSGYPEGQSFEENFYAALTPNAPTPEFSDELGAVTVQLTYTDTDDRPVRGQWFFLAEMLPVQGMEEGYVPALDSLTAQSGYSDSHGVLVISFVPAGKYSLVLMTPLGAILVESADSSEPIVIDVTPGELTDLGSIAVLLNPEPLEP